MSRVGEAGRGESVWLGWFLCAALRAFIPVAAARHDRQVAAATAWAAPGVTGVQNDISIS